MERKEREGKRDLRVAGLNEMKIDRYDRARCAIERAKEEVEMERWMRVRMALRPGSWQPRSLFKCARVVSKREGKCGVYAVCISLRVRLKSVEKTGRRDRARAEGGETRRGKGGKGWARRKLIASFFGSSAAMGAV